MCEEQRGRTLRQMVTALISAFPEAKMKDQDECCALLGVGCGLACAYGEACSAGVSPLGGRS